MVQGVSYVPCLCSLTYLTDVLKFHHLTSLLLDSNCLVLVLKIFGLQEISAMVQTKNEMPDCSFFRYIHLHASKGGPRPEDEMLNNNQPQQPTMGK